MGAFPIAVFLRALGVKRPRALACYLTFIPWARVGYEMVRK